MGTYHRKSAESFEKLQLGVKHSFRYIGQCLQDVLLQDVLVLQHQLVHPAAKHQSAVKASDKGYTTNGFSPKDATQEKG